MYYFILIILILLSLVLGYKSKRLYVLLTKDEEYLSAERLGSVRSYVYVMSVILSFVVDIASAIISWVEYGSTIGNPFMPISFIYGEAYGASIATQVFFVLSAETVCICAVSFLRGLSMKLIIRYIIDGECAKYKYVKKVTRVLVFAFLLQILYMILTAIENEMVLRLIGESNHIDPNRIVNYNFIWIVAFFTLSNTYKKKIKFASNLSSSPLRPVTNTITQSLEIGGKSVRKEIYDYDREVDPKLNTVKLPATQLSPDETRLAELEAELKKIPVAKVKQWYADGKLTEEQYKSIARKYNTLRKEINDIKERMELLQSIDEE